MKGEGPTDLVEAVAALGGFLAREVAQAIVFGLGVAALRVIERWSVVVSIDVAMLIHIHAEISQALEVGEVSGYRSIRTYLFHRCGSFDTKQQPW